MKLYELSEQYRTLDDLLMQGIENQSDADAYAKLYEELQGSFEEKAEAICCVMRNTQAFVQAVEDEIARLKDRKQALESKIDRLKDYLETEMVKTDQDKLKTPLFTIWMQQNPSSVQVDELLLPDEFWRVKREPDKTAIKAALEKGSVEGAQIVQGEKSLRFK
jgi:predicted nuclease with TOPRIM domain